MPDLIVIEYDDRHKVEEVRLKMPFSRRRCSATRYRRS
jgi:hypothetical protein